MAREKEGYRDNIEQLNRLYPSHEALSLEEVAQVLNCSTKTVRRNLGHLMVHSRIMKTALAKYMCG
jgi:DeoR/GlpR family transcriptional regulator of sugar metabolism